MQEAKGLYQHPQELVKIFAAYTQAQAALLDKPLQPEAVMTQVLVRFEQANSRKVPNTSATPNQALVLPLMGLTLERPSICPSRQRRALTRVTQPWRGVPVI